MSDHDDAGGRYASPGLECDIVMKGGITSGVVYPGAVAELAEHYRFRAIGGTSAGAIAAALVAAAEYRRSVHGDPRGFVEVEGLPDLLGERETRRGDLRLLRLFQPDSATAPLFRGLLVFLRHGPWLGVLGLWGAFYEIASALLVVAAAMLVLALTGVVVIAVALPIGVCALLAALVTPFVLAVRAAIRLKDNNYGLCTLGPEGVGDGPALTPWLHRQIQATAGRTDGDVLTFADLWGIEPAVTDVAQRTELLLAPSADASLRRIDLQMMTTDLGHGRPRRLPSGWHPRSGKEPALDDGGGLFYERRELARFFPAEVMAYMDGCARTISDESAARLPGGGRGFLRFPMGPELPVVVATRMSLSFPLLIAALPLWEIDYDDPAEQAREVLFSDGGITSNFPVHFFDAALPTRPTFGLNLTALEGQAPEGVEAQGAAVGPLPAASGKAPDSPRSIASLLQFGGALKDAMQNWNDNLQARQPGFRDRIVPIRLAAGEGGMALTMREEKIRDLSARGRAAATLLTDRFADGSGGTYSGWNNHRFVRFRVTMAATEVFLTSFDHAYAAPDDAFTDSYRSRAEAAVDRPPYALGAGQLTVALARADRYCASDAGSAQGDLTDGAPRPRPVARVVPPA